jgi:nucleoid-associated protein YgaU
VTTRNDPPATVPAGDLPVYRVGKGEQLFEVAKKTLGDGYRWSEIYALNKEQLRDSTELRADMLLRLPGDAKLDGPKAR